MKLSFDELIARMTSDAEYNTDPLDPQWRKKVRTAIVKVLLEAGWTDDEYDDALNERVDWKQLES